MMKRALVPLILTQSQFGCSIEKGGDAGGAPTIASLSGVGGTDI